MSGRRRALAWTVAWIAVAGLFGLGVLHARGPERAGEFFSAYLLEKSLSVDNLFLFLVVFRHLRIPEDAQRRVLGWGILGALLMRGAFLALGVSLISRWHALVYVLGAVLVATGVKLALPQGRGAEQEDGESRVLGWIERKLPATRDLHGRAFFVRKGGKLLATPLFVALVAIELSDVAFAIDSVPAAFAVTDYPFVLYTSNILAMLGLRALYGVLSESLSRSRELEIALASILVFAGAKMLLAGTLHVPPLLSVGVIASCLGAAIVARVARARRRRAPA